MALAALMTGGTFSARGGGSGVVATSPPAAEPTGARAVMEDDVFIAGGAIVPPGVVVAAPELGLPPRAGLLSETGNSCRRTGSGPDWNREAMAGVFRNAPGTGRTGVVCGNDMSGSCWDPKRALRNGFTLSPAG